MNAPAAPLPLTPADCDLRGLDYMPFFGNHLLGSSFNAAASDAEWRAGITLYWAAWNQVPAGSLPDDDAALCRLADLGRDLKGWEPLRARALHGFILCSDGRLYHPFLCRQALVAWEKRTTARERKALWRSRKTDTKAKPEDVMGPSRGRPGDRNGDVPAEAKRSEAKGQKPLRGFCSELRSADTHSGTEGHSVPPSRRASARWPKKQPKDKGNSQQPLTEESSQQPKCSDDWRATVKGIMVKGESLGLGRFDGQGDWDEYRTRVFRTAAS